ncbi:hypothetical protein B0J14DRAFT_619825 [Halenospora varia]|nr:hypothetical protein B0J14DRAFT_619825 [Halenospora varia]
MDRHQARQKPPVIKALLEEKSQEIADLIKERFNQTDYALVAEAFLEGDHIEIFSDCHFRPLTKLWVFQALLLLELYKKMYSTRVLHERAHVNHITTITLMRRGSSLITTALDYNAPGCVMVTHEMRLPLLCYEALWSAPSGAEFGRIMASLYDKGVKPVSFIEGLKRILNAQEVRTNSFGRTILMAGLLCTSWHMNQRDLLVNSLCVSQASVGNEWRGSITQAFDVWKQDFDRSLARASDESEKKDNVVFQSGTVLYHLAYIATHVDIVDCQIFAGAKRVLGRHINSQDLNGAQCRIDKWAPTAKARDATWHALRFLYSVLIPEEAVALAVYAGYDDPPFEYSAQDDVVLNRPWVMYFAALIVWCYGYALEGPANSPVPAANDFKEQVRDMRVYLRKLGGLPSPEDLKSMRGFNGCRGMLMALRTVFEKSRWELLHEAAL